MKVKTVHFIDLIPGQPIYEMESGEIRVPMPDTKAGQILWLNEKQALNVLVDKSVINQEFIRQHFLNIKKCIGKLVLTNNKI